MQSVNPVCLNFGKILRRHREARGLSQEKLADIAGLHRTYLGGLERGERNPTLTSILRVCEALAIAPSQLFADMDEG